MSYGKPTLTWDLPKLPDPTIARQVLFRGGYSLAPRELNDLQHNLNAQGTQLLSKLYGLYKVLQGLQITIDGNYARVGSGRLAVPYQDSWVVLDIDSFALVIPTTGRLYIGLEVDVSISPLALTPTLLGDRHQSYVVQMDWHPTTHMGRGYPIADIADGLVRQYGCMANESLLSRQEDDVRLRLVEELGDFIAYGLYPTRLTPTRLYISPGVLYRAGRRIELYNPSIVLLASDTVYIDDQGQLTSPSKAVLLSTHKVLVSSQGLPIVHSQTRDPVLVIQNASHGQAFYTPLVSVDPLVEHIPRYSVLTQLRDIQAQCKALYRELSVLNFSKHIEDILLGDTEHPLYTAYYDPSGSITQGRFIHTLPIAPYIPPYTEVVSSYQTKMTELNLVPPTQSPTIILDGKLLQAYNLPSTPLDLHAEAGDQSVTILKAMVGSATLNQATSNAQGLLTLELSAIPDPATLSLGPYSISSAPQLDRGIGQGFTCPIPFICVGASVYLSQGFSGLICLCWAANGIPSQPVLQWQPIEAAQSGWVSVSWPPTFIDRPYAVILTTSITGWVGAYTVGFPLLEDGSETADSISLLSAVSNDWSHIRQRDMVCKIHKAEVVSPLKAKHDYDIAYSEPFDGIEPHLLTQTPPNTRLSYTWSLLGAPLMDLDSFIATSSLILSVGLDSPYSTTFPVFLGGAVDLWVSRKDSTWVSKNVELPYIYHSVRVKLAHHVPLGASIKVYISSNRGQTWLPMQSSDPINTTTDLTQVEYSLTGLSPSTSMEDVNRMVVNMPRNEYRLRIDLHSTQSHIRPVIYQLLIEFN